MAARGAPIEDRSRMTSKPEVSGGRSAIVVTGIALGATLAVKGDFRGVHGVEKSLQHAVLRQFHQQHQHYQNACKPRKISLLSVSS